MVFAFKGKDVKIETYQNKLCSIEMSHNGTLFKKEEDYSLVSCL